MILIDLETRSPVDLKAEGGRRYAAHPGSHVLTVSWIDGETRNVWFPTLAVVPPVGLTNTQLPGVIIHAGPTCPVPPGELVAHNAWGFDSFMWKWGDRQWRDTEPLARASGLPGGLDAIGKTLRGEGKWKEGSDRLKKFMNSASKPPGVGDLVMIAKYNLDDVEILKLLWEYLAARPHFEPEVLRTHKKINDRGIRLDVDLCRKLSALSEESVRRMVAQINQVTSGELPDLESLRSRPTMFKWIEGQQGKIGKSLRKDRLETLFRNEEDEFDAEDEEGNTQRIVLTPLVRQVLMLRFSALRISAAKVNAAVKAVTKGRLHDILVYYGAQKTGRWAGRRVQPHNLPRPKPGVDMWRILDTDMTPEGVLSTVPEAIAELRAKDQWDEKNPIPTLDDCISGCLRGIFLPDDDHYFAAADYNAVEARVLAWLAGEETLLQMFKDGIDPYLWMASKLYGVPVTNKKDPRRQVGKVVILGSGFQLGAEKMAVYAMAQGIDLDAAGVTPEQAIDTYRNAFPAIAGTMTSGGWREGGIWNELNYAAIRAMHTGRASYRMIDFRYDGRDLKMHLPSGRPLYYPRAMLEDIVPKFGGRPKKTVTYWNPRGFRDTMYGGKWAENATQGTARDPLAEAIVLSESEGIPVPLHVHDEGVGMVKDEKEAIRFTEIMATLPPWATGLPLTVECDTLPRYAKSPPRGWKSYVRTS